MSEGSRYNKYYQGIGPALKKPSIRAYTMIALSLFALSFFGAFAIRPAVKEIFELNRKIVDRQLVQKQLDEKIQNLRLAQAAYENVQTDLPIVLKALPQEPEFTGFLKNVEKIATNSGVPFNSLKFGGVSILEPGSNKSAPNVNPPLKEIGFSFDVSGNYPNLLSFIKSIENWERIINIGAVSFTVEKGGSYSAELRTNATAQTYYSSSNIETREVNE